MADVKPFACIRPQKRLAASIAALPYDMYNRREATKEVERKQYSFLKIDSAETQFEESVDSNSDCVYQKAKEILESWIKEEILFLDEKECYYIYELTQEGHIQTGIVGCVSVTDYLTGIIKQHEKTREEKEQDRIRHIDTCNAQTGPIFLIYRSKEELERITEETKTELPLYDFKAEDGVIHRVWKIDKAEQIQKIYQIFLEISSVYIADGHHRAAAAVKVAIKRGEEKTASILSVLFPAKELTILPYHRIVKDSPLINEQEFLHRISEQFELYKKEDFYIPQEKGMFGMYLRGNWYQLIIKQESLVSKKNIKNLNSVLLDVSILQDTILTPLFKISNPRTDSRIDFIGGIHSICKLKQRLKNEDIIVFTMYKTSLEELFEISDSNRLMPPKSTWFEPKLRSGLFIHKI